MYDVPWYLAFDSGVRFVWRPFFRVIEGAYQDTTVPFYAARSQWATTVGTKGAL